MFSESLEDAYSEDRDIGVVRFWARTIIDLCKSLIIQHMENQKGNVPVKIKSNNIFMQNKINIRIVLVIAFILLLPLLAMQFTDEVVWDLVDFVVGGTLLFTTGIMYWLITKKISNIKYRTAATVGLAVALLLVWMQLAVGVIDGIMGGT